MLKGILARLVEIALSLVGLGDALSLLGLKVDKTAIEDEPGTIQQSVTDIRNAVIESTSNLNNIMTQIKFINDDHENSLATVLNAIAELPSGSSIPSASDNAAGVWSAIDLASQLPNLSYGEEIAQAHQWAAMMWHAGSLSARWAPFFNISPPTPGGDSRPTDFTWPKPDWADIVVSDTLLSWLTRTCPDFSWTDDIASGGVIGYLAELFEYEAPHYTSRLTSYEWKRLYNSVATTPPVWPGEPNITRGESVPLAQGVVLSGPMDGVELIITATQRLIPYMSADTYKLYKSLGRYVFINDAGDLEPWLPIPADVCQLVPKAMTHALGCLLSFYTGVTGSVTPWTINA